MPIVQYVLGCLDSEEHSFSSDNSYPFNITIFLSMLMQLMFLATCTRPDILTAVCALATKCKEPREADQVRLHRVIGYLAEYPTLELHCNVTDLQLHAYFDAGWALILSTRGWLLSSATSHGEPGSGTSDNRNNESKLRQRPSVDAVDAVDEVDAVDAVVACDAKDVPTRW